MRGNNNPFISSTIFDGEEEDCKDNPFVFEKFDLNDRKENYEGFRIQGSLYKKSIKEED